MVLCPSTANSRRVSSLDPSGLSFWSPFKNRNKTRRQAPETGPRLPSACQSSGHQTENPSPPPKKQRSPPVLCFAHSCLSCNLIHDVVFRQRAIAAGASMILTYRGICFRPGRCHQMQKPLWRPNRAQADQAEGPRKQSRSVPAKLPPLYVGRVSWLRYEEVKMLGHISGA